MSSGRSRSGVEGDVEHLEPVEQILAKIPALHRLLQIAVGGRNHADVGLLRPRAAEPLELALLQDPQKLGLGRRAHLADFVQEQHAAGCQLDLAGLGLLSAGEGAAFVSEQLGFEKLLGQRRAVERDEWSARPRRRAMDESRHDFLARARLPCQEHGRIGRGDLRGFPQHVLPRLGVSDDASVADLRAELVGEQLDARLEALRAGTGFGDLPRRLRELLVRHGQGDMVGNPARDGEIAAR